VAVKVGVVQIGRVDVQKRPESPRPIYMHTVYGGL